MSCGDWNASTPAASNSTSATPLIWVVTFKLDSDVDNFVHLLNFWIQALLVKLLPCCGLTVLSAVVSRSSALWSHGPQCCGLTVLSAVVSRSSVLWSHGPQCCGLTVLSAVVSRSSVLWYHCPQCCGLTVLSVVV